MAQRIAEELEVELGGTVGYAVRFTDRSRDDTLVRLMTDGLLLAEIRRDPLLRRYDTVIVDEAHERSLNVDFLLGYLKRILPRRPDLKLIITSATIDPQRFSAHFDDAPVVEVSGRTYPVEVRHRPLADPAYEDAGADRDPAEAIGDAVDELVGEGPGDAARRVHPARRVGPRPPARPSTHALPRRGRGRRAGRRGRRSRRAAREPSPPTARAAGAGRPPRATSATASFQAGPPEGFAALRDGVAAGLPEATAQMVDRVVRVLDVARAARAALDGLTAPALQPAGQDVDAQLRRLLPDGFVATTGAGRLADLERHVEGALRRVQRLPDAVATDRMGAVHELEHEHAHAALLASRPSGHPLPEQLAEVPWLLEELRVSLFAQGVGARGPVSAKRIRRVLAEARTP
ncbi:MAG: DUF3418 domain-containing protein [Solirubrobacteraceae bacterium MAG38_C4-C5]|nr:DUF3418 domain-containing protein [Candidatus Siliceabacter maunaloa]